MWTFIIKSYIFHLFDVSNNQFIENSSSFSVPNIDAYMTLFHTEFCLVDYLILKDAFHDFHQLFLCGVFKKNVILSFRGHFSSI